jgi:membrane-bound lytic murein transglycosylase D
MIRGKLIAAAIVAASFVPAWSSVGTRAAFATEAPPGVPAVVQAQGSLTEAAAAISKSPYVLPQPKPIPPFPILLNKLVQHYVDQYLDHPHVLEVSFERSRAYLPEMTREMRAAGIPEDLVFLAFAESGFSHRGKGPWQFSVATARRFGLKVNHWIDERRDPIRSTRAAAEYLASLHDSAGNDWRVALIGWNGGDLAIDRFWELRGSNFNRFMDLLPRATRVLLGRFMAVAFIAHNAAAYGIGNVDYDSPPPYKEVPVRGGQTLAAVAKQLHTNVSRLRDLNPAILHDRVPPCTHTYRIRVPLMRASFASRTSTSRQASATF